MYLLPTLYIIGVMYAMTMVVLLFRFAEKNERDSRETFSIKFSENKENKPANIIL